MEREEEITKYYELEESDTMTVSEPAVLYGEDAILDLDETKRYTYADYLTWWDDKRRELINGFIRLMSPAASPKHARVSSKLVYAITDFIEKRKGKCLVFNAPFDVRLPKKSGEKADDKIYTVVQPDICLLCDLSKLDKTGCIGAPDLMIEIASPSNRRYDETKKLRAYQSAGVPEYWIVYPKKEAITVYLLQPTGKYDQGTIYGIGAKVPVRVLKGLKIDMEKLFGEFRNSPYY